MGSREQCHQTTDGSTPGHPGAGTPGERGSVID